MALKYWAQSLPRQNVGRVIDAQPLGDSLPYPESDLPERFRHPRPAAESIVCV